MWDWGRLGARLCPLLALVGQRVVKWPPQHSCQRAEGSRVLRKAKPLCKMSSSASATDTAAITKATKLPEFSGSKAEGKISDGLNHGGQMLLSLNCPGGAEL